MKGVSCIIANINLADTTWHTKYLLIYYGKWILLKSKIKQCYSMGTITLI